MEPRRFNDPTVKLLDTELSVQALINIKNGKIARFIECTGSDLLGQ